MPAGLNASDPASRPNRIRLGDPRSRPATGTNGEISSANTHGVVALLASFVADETGSSDRMCGERGD